MYGVAELLCLSNFPIVQPRAQGGLKSRVGKNVLYSLKYYMLNAGLNKGCTNKKIWNTFQCQNTLVRILPSHKFLPWKTSLLCTGLKLAWGGSATNGSIWSSYSTLSSIASLNNITQIFSTYNFLLSDISGWTWRCKICSVTFDQQ